MATASTFRRVAGELDQLATDVRNAITDKEGVWGESVTTGGPLYEIINQAFMATTTNANAIAARLEELADTCEWRAAQCDDWNNRYDDWERSDPRVGSAPAPPGTWASRS